MPVFQLPSIDEARPSSERDIGHHRDDDHVFVL
jgi:hypothetical protein